jgi:allantoinase
VDEFSHVTERDLRDALPHLAKLGMPLLAHAELPSFLRDFTAPLDRSPSDPRQYSTWLHSRPPESEQAAIELLVGLAAEFDARVHVVHLASADAITSLSAARARGTAVSAETCPHYLTFAAEDIPAGATAFKCAPPIRERHHRERLWQGLKTGAIDLIASDHSPAPPVLKRLEDGDFVRAWGGVASLQIGLAAVWSGMVTRGLALDQLGRWMAEAPARLAGLEGAKGLIAPGCDADLVIWDPDGETLVDGAALYHRHPVTPYDGARLRGAVKTTLLRGEAVFEDGECRGEPAGRLIARRGSRAPRASRMANCAQRIADTE